jgi:hypothetical protein
MTALTAAHVEALTGWQPGRYDFPCPICGATKAGASAKAKKLRIWIEKPDRADWHCVRCEYPNKGWISKGGGFVKGESDAVAEAARKEAERKVKAENDARRVVKAKELWAASEPAAGTVVERYLRDARKLDLDGIPPTIRFHTPTPAYPWPMMISALGIPDEPEPGVYELPLRRVQAVHLSFLRPDGSGRADTGDRPRTLMRGLVGGNPIALIPPNEGLGLLVGEGVETALSGYFKDAPIGVWAAGAATFLPKLAPAVPDWIECVTVAVDDDDAGRSGAATFMDALIARGIDVRRAECLHGE